MKYLCNSFDLDVMDQISAVENTKVEQQLGGYDRELARLSYVGESTIIMAADTCLK